MKPGRQHPWRTPNVDASQSPLVSSTATNRQKAGERAIAAETARTVPSDKEIDDAAEITPADIESAVSAWDSSQEEADTGLEGMLDARVNDAE